MQFNNLLNIRTLEIIFGFQSLIFQSPFVRKTTTIKLLLSVGLSYSFKYQITTLFLSFIGVVVVCDIVVLFIGVVVVCDLWHLNWSLNGISVVCCLSCQLLCSSQVCRLQPIHIHNTMRACIEAELTIHVHLDRHGAQML